MFSDAQERVCLCTLEEHESENVSNLTELCVLENLVNKFEGGGVNERL